MKYSEEQLRKIMIPVSSEPNTLPEDWVNPLGEGCFLVLRGDVVVETYKKLMASDIDTSNSVEGQPLEVCRLEKIE